MQIVRTPCLPISHSTTASRPDHIDREVVLGPVAPLARRSPTCTLYGYRYSLVDGAFVSAPAGSTGRLKVFSTRVANEYLHAFVEHALRAEGNP